MSGGRDGRPYRESAEPEPELLFEAPVHDARARRSFLNAGATAATAALATAITAAGGLKWGAAAAFAVFMGSVVRLAQRELLMRRGSVVRIERIGALRRLRVPSARLVLRFPFELDGKSVRRHDTVRAVLYARARDGTIAFGVIASAFELARTDDWFDGALLEEDDPPARFFVPDMTTLIALRDALA